MIEKMSRYDFILLDGEREQFLQDLTELGVVDITRSSKAVDEHSQDILSGISDIKSRISEIERGSDAHLQDLLAHRAALIKEKDEVRPWGEFDKERLEEFGVRWFCVPAKKFDPEWENQLPVQKVCESDGKIWFVTLGEGELPVKEIPAPGRTADEVGNEIERIDNDIASHRDGLNRLKADVPAMKEKIDDLQKELDLYLASKTAGTAGEGSIAIFRGFAPESEDSRLEAAFNAMPVVWLRDKAVMEDNPPIKLRNNSFASQFETLTGMYGFPTYNEFDPTPVLAPFFLLFFAMCMGDAGYGILLVIIAYILKGMKGGLASMWKLVRFLGIGTFFVGILLGTFFGISLFDAVWVPAWLKKCMIVEGNIGKIAGFDPQIVMTIGIGILHICLAMVVKTACVTKQSGVKENLSTWGWTLLIVGGVTTGALAIGGLLGGAALKWTVISIAVLSALGIFIFNKPGRNPLLNIGAGLWDSYNMATGILGDTLSYIRLYALGLAGGMLGGAFNSLGLMMVEGGNATWQWIPFAIILLIGHALNLAMSCLGAFVHPLRLTFVEYFKNSGYEGRGTQYKPLTK